MPSPMAIAASFARASRNVASPSSSTVGSPRLQARAKAAAYFSKPAADGALVAAMERLILGTTPPNKEISPLIAAQRLIRDEYRAVEKAIQELHNLLAAENVDPVDRSKMEVGVITHAVELMRLDRRILELDAAVIAAALRPA